MNKFVKFYRTVAVCVSLSLTASAWADAVQVGNLYYDLDSELKTATVARNDSYKEFTSVTIPGKVTVEGVDYTVTAVGQQAFQECVNLATLTVEEGVTEVGKWSFYKCSGLTSISLPKTLTVVGQSCFSNCSGLTSVVIPENVTTINAFGFATCANLAEVTLPAALKTLGNTAFQNDQALKTVNFNEGLETIEGSAFYNCGLETVKLPSTLKTLGTGAFSNCTKLESVEFPEGLAVVGNQAFFKCASLKEVNLPSSVETLGNNAFYECASLKEFKFPAGIKTINDGVFYGCTGLTSIDWPQHLTFIPGTTFYGCSSLSDIKLHDGLAEIGESSFYGCASLTTLKFPEGFTKIHGNAFNRCSSLESIELPSSLVWLCGGAFQYCSSLKELNIPEKVDSIGGSLITKCTSLVDINVAEGNKYFSGYKGCLLNKEQTELMVFAGGREECEMPETVTDILAYAFNQNTVIKSIKFSPNLKTIGLSAFAMSSNIEALDFPNTLEKIENTAFFYCRGIKSVRMPNNNALNVEIGNNALSALGISSMLFPEGLKNIGIVGENAFSVMASCSSAEWISLPSTLVELSPLGAGCNNLKALYCFAPIPPVLVGKNAVTVASVVKCPKGTAEAYKAAWESLYPNMTFEGVLPMPASVAVSGNTATISWETYSDDVYGGTPVRYVILLDDVEVATIEGEKATASNVSYTFSNLANNSEHVYTIKGFSAQGELSMLNKGVFDIATSGIDVVEAEEDVVSVEYYDVAGRQVAVPAANTLYVVRTVYADGTVKTAKELVK